MSAKFSQIPFFLSKPWACLYLMYPYLKRFYLSIYHSTYWYRYKNVHGHFWKKFEVLRLVHTVRFLGGLSLHLNHLIGSRVGNYNWQFGTLPFGLFGQIWTQWTLRHILGPILVNFDICHFLMILGPFEYFQKMGALRKSKFSRWRSDRLGGFWFSLVGQNP